MSVEHTEIEGLVVVRLKEVDDERGVVREFYRESEWLAAGLPSLGPWLQINVTESRRGAVRGLHGERMNKYVCVASGTVFGAYADARSESSSRGKVVTVEIDPGTAVLVPDGVCNGFQTTSEVSQYLYCFDAEWAAGMAGPSVDALDPALAIPWPLPVDTSNPAQLSLRDRSLPTLAEVLAQS